MSPEVSIEYQNAIEEAANAFMKVMALRGFSVRDYPQNFVAQMTQTTRLAFELSREGAHAHADSLVAELTRAAPMPAYRMASSLKKAPTQAFAVLSRRMA